MSDTAIRPGLDPLLSEVKRRLVAFYGDRLDRVVLFGSRARGDHNAESDYDVAVFLRDYDGKMAEVERLADISWELWEATGAVLSMKPFDADDWRHDTLIMRHIHHDGFVF